eukprot:634569-Amphidinium_carterae.1
MAHTGVLPLGVRCAKKDHPLLGDKKFTGVLSCDGQATVSSKALPWTMTSSYGPLMQRSGLAMARCASDITAAADTEEGVCPILCALGQIQLFQVAEWAEW